MSTAVIESSMPLATSIPFVPIIHSKSIGGPMDTNKTSSPKKWVPLFRTDKIPGLRS